MNDRATDRELLEWAKGQDFRSCQQRTIARSVSFSGKSMVDGQQVRVSMHPAGPNTGLVFRRIDLQHRPEIPASLANVCRSSIYIALTCGGGREGLARRLLRGKAHRTLFRYLEHLLLRLPEPHVALVEHLLAVAYLLVDNLIVEVDRSHLPYMDFHEFARKFMDAGIAKQTAGRKMFTVDRQYKAEGKNGQWMEVWPGEQLFVEYSVDFSRKSMAVGKQRHAMVLTPESFVQDVSCARSLFLARWRRFVTDIYRSVDYSPQNLSKILVADGSSYLNAGPDAPRYMEGGFSTEVVRHKVGDLVGEMALTGVPLLARFRIHRGGHAFILKAFQSIIESGLLREL